MRNAINWLQFVNVQDNDGLVADHFIYGYETLKGLKRHLDALESF